MIKLRTLKIVIRETGKDSGEGFEVFLEGDKERIPTIAEDRMSPAEYWGCALFDICVERLKSAGAVKTMTVESEESKGELH